MGTVFLKKQKTISHQIEFERYKIQRKFGRYNGGHCYWQEKLPEQPPYIRRITFFRRYVFITSRSL